MAETGRRERASPRYGECRAFIEERGVRPGADGHTKEQLRDELHARGWVPSFDGERAEARKAGPTGGPSEFSLVSFFPAGADLVTVLTILLADAIRHDEEQARAR